MAQVPAISTGAVFKWHNGTALQTIGRVVNYRIRGMTNVVQTTAQESGLWHECIAGKRSFEVEIGIQLDESDAQHIQIQTDAAAGTARAFEFTVFPDATGFTGTAIVQTLPIQEHYTDLVTMNLLLRGSEPLETTNYGNTGGGLG